MTCGECQPSERDKKSAEYKKHHRNNQGKLPFSHFKLGVQLEIINDFLFTGDYAALSDKYKVTQDTLRGGIKLFRQRLNEIYELVYMTNAEKTTLPAEVIENALKTDFVKETLRDMLSGDEEETLTDHEIMYCHVFVNTGSNVVALQESQLDICLKEKTPVRLQYLGMHLRAKPNLKQYIKALQDGRLDEITTSKKHVQRELITQIEQLREKIALSEGKGDRSNIIKCIELLGKTEGAFEERVKLEGVSAASALDRFLEMAKAEIRELPPGSPTDESYAPVPD